MNIKISNGEFLDRLSILEIKLEKIKDPKKVENINREFVMLNSVKYHIQATVNSITNWLSDLKVVNRKLWEIEDLLRDKEKYQEFDDEFIGYARSVYQLNDERARIKRQINELTNSEIVEEKSYTEY